MYIYIYIYTYLKLPETTLNYIESPLVRAQTRTWR